MKKSLFKKILLYSGGIFLLLVLVLVVHIYMVTRPKAPDAKTIIMARIDIKKDIDQNEANTIATWLSHQPGVDHAFCNPKSNIAVFTFHPVITTGDLVVKNFKSNFEYDAVRFMPSADDMKNGCPVASTSPSYKLYSYIKKILD